MPDLYLPGEESLEKITSLVQGFWLEIDDENRVVIIFKLEASITTQLIKGCKFELIARNPKLCSRCTTLYIYDNPESPFYVTWENFGAEDNDYIGFDKIIIKLLKAAEVRIAFFNEANLPIFTTIIKKDSQFEEFQKWILNIYSKNDLILEKITDGNFHPEDSNKGFKITLKNTDNSETENIKIYSPELMIDWGKDWMSGKDYFSFNEYLKDGKHGYNQEFSIRANLTRYFTPNEELFHSPTKDDGTELIDFIIYYKNIAILLESKFVLSSKKTNFNTAISKAITQLKYAKEFIEETPNLLKNDYLKNQLSKPDIILRICVYNDTLGIIENDMTNIIKKFEKKDLPIFISVSTLSQLLGSIKIKNEKDYKYNFMYNLINIYIEFLKSESKILMLREFRIQT